MIQQSNEINRNRPTFLGYCIIHYNYSYYYKITNLNFDVYVNHMLIWQDNRKLVETIYLFKSELTVHCERT